MKYAPVIIPTLCRYEHFKECIESLSRCTWAEYTEVYVGLDYPAKESHWEGYKKIKSYLEGCGDMNFKKLHVIVRPYNYGAYNTTNEISNSDDLEKRIFDKYDRYIFSEDDNVFSPDFLEYIDKGLEKYENDDSVYAIVGYCHPYPFEYKDNNSFHHQTDFSAWGYGVWTAKESAAQDEYSNILFKHPHRIKNIKKLLPFGYNRVLDFLIESLRSSHEMKIDNDISTYLQLTGKTVIVPTMSKVRNIGWDGSGQSKAGIRKEDKKISAGHNYQKIDEGQSFDFEGDPWAYFDENNRIAAEYSDGKISLTTFLRQVSVITLKTIVKKIIRWDKIKEERNKKHAMQ